MQKGYFIFTPEGKLVPVDVFDYTNKEGLFSLVQSECCSRNTVDIKKRKKVENILQELGFEWDPLAYPGYMRQKTTAVMMQEMMEDKYWNIAEQFCAENNIKLHNISSGELFKTDHPYFMKQLEIIKKGQMYGTDLYDVTSSDGKQILRYIACANKHIIAKELNLKSEDLPIAFFEISKSYRHEKKEELCLCSRICAFHNVDTHILFNTFQDGLKMLLKAHKYSLSLMKELYPKCELLCNISQKTFEQHKPFMEKLGKTLGGEILLNIIPEDTTYGNDTNIDLEYKIIDYSGCPLEFATLQLDDGTSQFAYDIRANDANGASHNVSTMHTVFLGSVERAIYACVDSALQKMKPGECFLPLPDWINPINVRFICDFKVGKQLKDKLLAFEKHVGCVDVDDRNIDIAEKTADTDAKYIPLFVIIKKSKRGFVFNLKDGNKKFILETNKLSDIRKYCIEKMSLKTDKKRYFPLLKSGRVL